MYHSDKPIPESWYVSETGKVVKVRMLLYQGGELKAVITESLEGRHYIIQRKQWDELHLSRYCCRAKKFWPE